MGNLLGRIMLPFGVIGLIGSFTLIGFEGRAIKKARNYLTKTVVPVEQKIEFLETNPLGAIYSDPNVPKDFNELISYHQLLIEQRDTLNKTPEVTKARKEVESIPIYSALPAFAAITSLVCAIKGYQLVRGKRTED